MFISPRSSAVLSDLARGESIDRFLRPPGDSSTVISEGTNGSAPNGSGACTMAAVTSDETRRCE